MEELRERYRQITLTDDKQFPIHLTLNGRKPQKLTLSAVEELIKELTQAIAQPPQAEEVCTWEYQESDDMWQSSCGRAWSFIDGDPIANEVNYCQGCGKPLFIKPESKE